jgi:putative membrane protein
MKRLGIAALILLAGPHANALAHGGDGHPSTGWTWDPWITVPLILSALLYGRGALVLQRRGIVGRSTRRWQALAYGAGWLCLAGALVSPLHEIGEQLFTAHMIEHEIVMTVAAPLLVLARPGGAFLWAFPTRTRRRLGATVRARSTRRGWTVLTRPLTATLLHAIAIWVWHVPLFFDAAVTNVVLHRLQHLSFFLTAVLFWWAMLWRANPAIAAGEIFVTMLHTSVLGALLTFSPRVLYDAQTVLSERWGLTPLEDQQLAGLVMWVPVGTVYAAAAIAFFACWVRRSGRRWKAVDAPAR